MIAPTSAFANDDAGILETIAEELGHGPPCPFHHGGHQFRDGDRGPGGEFREDGAKGEAHPEAPDEDRGIGGVARVV